MTGYHRIQRFTLSYNQYHNGTAALPEGWKPFAAWPGDSDLIIVLARKWCRGD